MKSYSVTIQMTAFEQYFPVALFIMLALGLCMKSYSVTIQKKLVSAFLLSRVKRNSPLGIMNPSIISIRAV